MRSSRRRQLLLCTPAWLGGCLAPPRLPGYEAAFQGYRLDDALLQRVRDRLHQQGLKRADVARDPVGRAQLVGRYADEDEVDQAFIILRSLAGPRAASPFYPSDVLQRRWEQQAAAALQAHADALARAAPPARRRALVVGISRFLDHEHLATLQGEEDARRMAEYLAASGYETTVLLGPQAGKRQIERALLALSRQLGRNDELFLYVSSHGAMPVPGPAGPTDRQLSVVAFDSGDVLGRRSHDAADYLLNLHRSSVRDSLFQSLAQQPCQVARVLIDTCYSGEVLKDLAGEGAAAGLRDERDSISMERWSARALQLRSRYTLLTATSPGELALAPAGDRGSFASPLGHGRRLSGSFFTQALLEYLAHHQGQVQRAFDAARLFTAETARQLSAGRISQTPRLLSTLRPDQDRL